MLAWRRLTRVGADYLDASLSASLVSISGVGGFSPVDLDKVLRVVSPMLRRRLHLHARHIRWQRTRDLETALQLVYLHFTASTPTRRHLR